MTDTLPTVAGAGGDIALAGDATGAGIPHAFERLVANLHHRAESFDDINLSLNIERHPDGSSKSVFNYRCYKHRR